MQKIIFTTLLICGTLNASSFPEVLSYCARPLRSVTTNLLEAQPRQLRPFKVVYEKGTKEDFFNLYVDGSHCVSGCIRIKDSNFVPLSLAYIVGSLRIIIENLQPKTVNVLSKILERGLAAIGSSAINESDESERLLNDWLDRQKGLVEHVIIATKSMKRDFDPADRIKYKDPRFKK